MHYRNKKRRPKTRVNQECPAFLPSPPRARALTLSRYTPTSTTAHTRDLFPTWITIEGNCDTRKYVLKSNTTSVKKGSNYYPDSNNLDIDHISGASEWTTDKRQMLANDFTRPQLWTVTDNLNESRGEDSPDLWKPPLESVYCVYARAWIEIKSFWDLAVTSSEKCALSDMLDTC
ncbi:secreted protein [Xylariaceae sp. FL0255]|nr:secreted protein [Xylariaceae sp. FL0255]